MPNKISMKVMTKPRFLEDAISKSFKAQEENKQIMRENQALNKKLTKIAGKQPSVKHSISVLSLPAEGSTMADTVVSAVKQASMSSTAGPDLRKFQDQKRRRDAERISKENLAMLRRLNAVRPEYSVDALRKQRKKESTILKLRRTNYTVGHILSQTLEPVRQSKMRSLAKSSFQSAATTAVTNGPEPFEPHIYVDPEALAHLPKSKPGSRRTRRPKGRSKSTQEKKTKRPKPPKNMTISSRASSRSPSPVTVPPANRQHLLKPVARQPELTEESSVNSQSSTTATTTVFSKEKVGVNKSRVD